MPLRPKSSSANKTVGVILVSIVTCRVTPVNTALVFVSHVCLPRCLILHLRRLLWIRLQLLVLAINASGTATDVMTTSDNSLAITAMEAVSGATTANDDPGAITSGAADETATAGIDVPAVNTSGTATMYIS